MMITMHFLMFEPREGISHIFKDASMVKGISQRNLINCWRKIVLFSRDGSNNDIPIKWVLMIQKQCSIEISLKIEKFHETFDS